MRQTRQQHDVSDATKNKIETIRDAFFLVLGASLLGLELWDIPFSAQTIEGLLNAVTLIGSGLIVTPVAFVLWLRLKRGT